MPRKADTHRMLAYLTLSIEYGADVIRVHDVEAACDLVASWTRLGSRGLATGVAHRQEPGAAPTRTSVRRLRA